ncbi:MAG: DUF4184 family protein [Cyanobacteria bacterium J06649_4]
MPFTLSHPIAVWPLWKLSQRRLDLPALAVGAAIPDITYFIALRPVGNIGHSIPGIFLEGIPSGLLLLLLGRYFLWQPTLAILPRNISSRLLPANTYKVFSSITRLFIIVLSVALGALSHIVWDSFTHKTGWGVQKIALLSELVFNQPIYKWLQYGGGLFGLLALLYLVSQALSKQAACHRHRHLSKLWQRTAWSVIALITIGTVLIAIFPWESSAIAPTYTASQPSVLIVCGIIGLVSGSFLGLCFYAAIFWTFRTFQNR